jgi:hypothetical protein
MVDERRPFAVRFDRLTYSMDSNMLSEEELALLDAIRQTGSLLNSWIARPDMPRVWLRAGGPLEPR